MTIRITTKQDQERYWAKRTITVYKGKLELAYRMGSISKRTIRLMADEDEECAELMRKIDEGLVTIDLYEEDEREELTPDEERESWNEILYWDEKR